MAKYTPRTTAPSSNNKNHLHTSAGGYNSCIHIKGGSCLPNGVGYAWGRAPSGWVNLDYCKKI